MCQSRGLELYFPNLLSMGCGEKKQQESSCPKRRVHLHFIRGRKQSWECSHSPLCLGQCFPAGPDSLRQNKGCGQTAAAGAQPLTGLGPGRALQHGTQDGSHHQQQRYHAGNENSPMFPSHSCLTEGFACDPCAKPPHHCCLKVLLCGTNWIPHSPPENQWCISIRKATSIPTKRMLETAGPPVCKARTSDGPLLLPGSATCWDVRPRVTLTIDGGQDDTGVIVGNYVCIAVFRFVHFQVGVLPGELLPRIDGLRREEGGREGGSSGYSKVGWDAAAHSVFPGHLHFPAHPPQNRHTFLGCPSQTDNHNLVWSPVGLIPRDCMHSSPRWLWMCLHHYPRGVLILSSRSTRQQKFGLMPGLHRDLTVQFLTQRFY